MASGITKPKLMPTKVKNWNVILQKYIFSSNLESKATKNDLKLKADLHIFVGFASHWHQRARESSCGWDGCHKGYVRGVSGGVVEGGFRGVGGG